MKFLFLLLGSFSLACAGTHHAAHECPKPSPSGEHEHVHAAHEHEHEHEHEHVHAAHEHEHARDYHPASAKEAAHSTDSNTLDPSHPLVVPHVDLKTFSNNGNSLTGLLTPSVGGGSLEIWESSVAPNGRTPRHTHSSPEIFVVLEGEGELIVGDETFPFKAPCTVYAPPNVPHEVHNTGTTKTRQIVIIEAHSHIVGADGTEMTLPWRKAPRGNR